MKHSLTQLRGIAQSFGIDNIFQKTASQLEQEISLKQKEMMPPVKIEVARPAYDARLSSKPPSRVSKEEEIQEIIRPFQAKGLYFEFVYPENWMMRWGDKEDTGTIRMPLRNILICAEKIMK